MNSSLPRLSLLAMLAATMVTAGCADMGMTETQQRTAMGAGIGAVAGGLLGNATGGQNTVRGAAIGAAAGGIIGNVWSRRMEAQKQAMEQATQGTGVDVVRTADNQLKLNIPNDISFATGSAAIKPELRQVLDQFGNGLKENPGLMVRVVGHTDSSGSDAVNNPLSVNRADSVRNYLSDRGVASSRIETAGRGSREPVASNDTAEGRAKNRRVEIFMRDPGQPS
ncbi:MAG: OmpA family protein [Burkholderiales bacterium]|nr:OmpA family protein [Burkholderiales bacterium]